MVPPPKLATLAPMPAPTRLFNRAYLGLLLTQFFGAMNDNVVKQLLVFAVASGGIWSDKLGAGGQSYPLLCLTVPFIVLSGIAGQLADRFDKQKITLWVKIAEIGIALVAMVGVLLANIWIAMFGLLLLAIQSAFFGPAKYGMIPEIVRDKDLSQANGTINMATNIAVIAGTVIAGPLYAMVDPRGPNLETYRQMRAWFGMPAAEGDTAPVLLAPGLVIMAIAVLGLVVCLLIPRLSPMNPGLKIDWNPFRPYWGALRDMARSSLLLVAIAWAFFYLIGMLALTTITDYTALLEVSQTRTGYLLGILGIAIGIGSVTAGLISGKHIEPRLVPVGAVGMSICFLLLGVTTPTYGGVALQLAGAGFFAGFYIVPLQTLLQHLSPDDERGRFLGTANALSFVASSLAAVIFYLARAGMNLPANRLFLLCAILASVGSGVLIWRLRKLIADPSIRRSAETV